MRLTRACARADLLLTEYVTGTLSSNAVGALEAHLARCERCRQEVLFLRRLLPMLASWRAQPAPAGLEGRVEASTSAAPAPAWQEAAALAALTMAALPVLPLALLFPVGLLAWLGASAAAALATLWAARHATAEVKPWGMEAPRGPFSPVRQS